MDPHVMEIEHIVMVVVVLQYIVNSCNNRMI